MEASLTILIAIGGIIDKKVLDLIEAARSVASKGIEIDVLVVDASRDKPSASKL